MCGRYSLKTPADIYEAVFRLSLHFELRRRYNIAPTQNAPVIRHATDSHQRESVMMRWGLIPSWAKDPKIGNRLINARIYTAHEKPAFRSAYKHRRCLIPADGFFEWQAVKGKKQPYYMHRSDAQPFAFAGLWESWKGDEGAVESYTILTCDASENLSSLHDRMPVVVPADQYDQWLSGEPSEAALLVENAHQFSETLNMMPVSRVVNTPANDTPDCIKPI